MTAGEDGARGYRVRVTPSLRTVARVRVFAPGGDLIADRRVLRRGNVAARAERIGRQVVADHQRARADAIRTRLTDLTSPAP